MLRTARRFGVPTVGLRGISDGRDHLAKLEDWTEHLHIIDEKLAAALDPFQRPARRRHPVPPDPEIRVTPSARLSAAIDILTDLITRRRPAGDAIKDWGLAHRFAGSGDRAALSGLVFDTLRRRASSAHVMGSDEPRALVLGMLATVRGLDVAAIERLCDGGRFAPLPSPPTNAPGWKTPPWRAPRLGCAATIPNGWTAS